MKRKTYFLGLFLFFLMGMGSLLAFRLWQVKKAKAVPFSPQKSSFTLKPPTEALKGKIAFVKGQVEKEPREKEEFEPVKAGAEILQGEKLATGVKSQAKVKFADFAEIKLGSKTEVSFINLIPAKFLIEQKSGSVSYELLQDEDPLSVRSLHALLTFDSGEGEISVENREITVKILSGKAKLAMVDLENETHVWQLQKGQKVLIDDAQRRVEIE